MPLQPRMKCSFGCIWNLTAHDRFFTIKSFLEDRKVILWDDVAENEFGILGNGSAHGSGLLFVIALVQMFATELSEPNTYFSDNNVNDYFFVLHYGYWLLHSCF